MLAAPGNPGSRASLGPDDYEELLAFLSLFYDAVLLDLGPGVVGPLARFAIRRADTAVLVTTQDWTTAGVVLAAAHECPGPTTIVVNKARPRSLAELRAVDERLQAEGQQRSVTIPHDERLAVMLDTGTYSLEALDRGTRIPIKQLGLAVAQQLV